MGENKPLVSVRNISKSFPGGIIALDNVSFDIYRGEIVALLGENGAGKSTMVKILYGVYFPDEGEIFIDGRKTVFYNPVDAIKQGIVMVSQIPQLIDRLSIRENLVIGLSILGFGKLARTSRVDKVIGEISGKLGMKIDPDTMVWKLTYTQKQMIEILRAFLLNAKLVILDEALTYLPLEERRRFYTVLDTFKKNGGSSLIITHKITEAMEIADRIIVLRRGKLSGILRREEASIEKIRELMFREDAGKITYERLASVTPLNENCISIEDLVVVDEYGRRIVDNARILVRKGEVVGIAGVAGSGQKELLQAVIGLIRVNKGRITIIGNDVTNKGVGLVRQLGVGYIPDIPLRHGISSDNTILENIAVLFQKDRAIIRWDEAREISVRVMKKYQVLARNEETPVKVLSGGNIMKVIVGRELEYSKTALIAYNPTRALDEVTAVMVRRIIKDKAANGRIGVLLASEDLDEIFQLSDTIYVMNSGKVYGPFNAETVKRSEIEHLMVM
ncbi:Ribose ABC transporter, ATP-binding protein [Desulfurococcus amylolyticus 1221n]|uniref:Ribose ABC transporter, ATP-binding protein n=1 Tax=Desulfurococcus amylolyticus (strain DSM 18924 / JCM 16383 / VKM B-2413 / 1221n) TaxID=490899 RepID=B8D4B4_DESA1|nr:ATP-binding cassette domain-containing protein [Desulfurococcus amylolyticus]ACL10945.1 Ribose ABC transporter, ATP-binding protein [Desulfurococcus amylolyticus 1221n]